MPLCCKVTPITSKLEVHEQHQIKNQNTNDDILANSKFEINKPLQQIKRERQNNDSN